VTGARICLLTTGQPSTNPRLVKEADALAASGHHVHVIGAKRADWADASDRELLPGRAWTSEIIEWRRRADGSRLWKAAIRHRIARISAGLPGGDGWLGAAASPVTPDLTTAALAWPADLYIAHNLGALPAGAAAASRRGALLGFDAEDFHSGQFVDQSSSECRIARQVESRFLPRCDYVTASSPGIADRYEALTGNVQPTIILNAFPTSERPRQQPTPGGRPRRLYWFSQTIGRDRGLEDAILAMGQLREFNLELHLRGEWQANFEDRLRALARNVGLREDQLVAHAPAPAGQMVRLAATYDVGLALEPGDSTNSDLLLSNKLFTYLLAGVPAILTETSGQRTFAASLGSAGQAVAIGNVNELAAALRLWLADSEAWISARQAAWDLGTRRYNWDLEQQKFLAVVDRVLGKRSPAGLPVAEMAR
jgi:glycosyltransferase involved in cell wall biosynthesis